MHKFIPHILIFLLLAGCTSSNLIGLRPSKEPRVPTRIIWLQVPGLLEEHLAMLRFENADSRILTAPENALCLGKSWQYDLYRLRHEAELGFLAQMSGSKNLKNKCEDYSTKPFWHYLQTLGEYKVGLLERVATSEHSFERIWDCEESDPSYRSQVMIWKMGKSSAQDESNFFHFQEQNNFLPGQISYDKSCAQEGCFASLEQNARALSDLLVASSKNSVLIIRDDRYQSLLQRGKILEAKEVLMELVKLYETFQFEVTRVDDSLLLLTSSEGQGLELPTQGVSWQQFQKRGKNVLYKRSSLMGSVFADGVQAQNFCGQYEESEIFKRILWVPKGGIKNLNFL